MELSINSFLFNVAFDFQIKQLEANFLFIQLLLTGTTLTCTHMYKTYINVQYICIYIYIYIYVCVCVCVCVWKVG